MTAPVPPTSLVGRHLERLVVDAAIDAGRHGRPSTLVVVGEPGIGKSALLNDVCAAHADATVIIAGGVESEQEIPFAALSALIGPLDDRIDQLDAPAARALRAAAQGTAAVPIPVISLALVELLATITDSEPVLVVLDDVHWFDQSSLAVIEFAVRRLGELPVITIAASRRTDSFDPTATTITLGPLDSDSAKILLDAGGAVAEHVSEHCRDLCGGNPLTLIELGMSLTADQRSGVRPLPELLPVAGRLERWLADRLDVLPIATRTALATLALAGTVAPPVLMDTLQRLDLDRHDLDAAEEAGIVETRGASVTFTHPLYATVAAARVGPAVRRTIHRVLAGTVSHTSAERQAWHLVEACETPDDVAAAVEGLRGLADRESTTGAHLAAAATWDRLASLLTDPNERAEALTAAGTASWDAGRPDLAIPRLRTARSLVPSGPTRAMAIDVFGKVVGWTESIEDGLNMLDVEAQRVEAERPDLAVNLLVAAATLASLGISPDAVALTERAETIAERCDDYTRLTARTVGTHVRLMAGEGSADRLAELDALGSLIEDGIDRSLLELAQLLGFGLMVRERWDEARTIHHRLIAAARAASLGGVESFGLAMSAEVAWRTGRWSQARGEAAADAAFNGSIDGMRGTFGDATLARVEAALGRSDDAREHARRAVEHGEAIGMISMTGWGRHALGLADLADGDPAAAVEHLEWIWDVVRFSGATDAGLLWWQGDLLEALVAVGRRGDARRLVDELDGQARATGRRWPEAMAARGRGMLDDDAAAARRSIILLDELDAPFEAARSQLVVAALIGGDAARPCLEDARRRFERLGSLPWIARCRTGTDARPDRQPQARPVIAALLTPAELRVAAAVGAGMSTREAAASLALSTRTIDAHLRSIFRKLHITSRSQLAVLVSEQTPFER